VSIGIKIPSIQAIDTFFIPFLSSYTLVELKGP